MTFTFQLQQEMKVKFIHGDDKPIGELEFNMSQLMGSKTQTFTGTLGPIKNEEETEIDAEPEDHGSVTIVAETVKQSKQHFDIKLKWQNVNNYSKTCCSLFKSLKPVYFEIQREHLGNDDMQGNWMLVWKSKTIYEHRMNATGGQVDFRYPQQTLSEVDLCNCERLAKLRFVLKDEDGNDLNSVTTSVKELCELKQKKDKVGDVSF